MFDDLDSSASSTVSSDKGCNSFFYFAFGSNLLADRVRINSPSATFVGPARLHKHQLAFAGWSESWKGAVANIVSAEDPEPIANENTPHNLLLSDSFAEDDPCIWGAVWRISNEQLPQLDKQEGVDIQEYEPVSVTVDLFESFGAALPTTCDEAVLTDQMRLERVIASIESVTGSQHELQKFNPISVRSYRKVKESACFSDNVKLGLMSDTYKLVILKGAVDCGLPLPYIKMLASLTTNGKSGFDGWKSTAHKN